MLQFTNESILQITKDGIAFKTPDGDMRVLFSQCQRNFAAEHSLSESNCVAARDIAIPSFTFYSNPRVVVLFKKKGFLQKLSGKKGPYPEFHELQRILQKFGYTTFDLT